jgi:hypothetical protein
MLLLNSILEEECNIYFQNNTPLKMYYITNSNSTIHIIFIVVVFGIQGEVITQ